LSRISFYPPKKQGENKNSWITKAQASEI